MQEISEHDTKEEWERNAGEHSWVYLFVISYTVSINNFLENRCELIRLEISWFGQSIDVVGAFDHIQSC